MLILNTLCKGLIPWWKYWISGAQSAKLYNDAKSVVGARRAILGRRGRAVGINSSAQLSLYLQNAYFKNTFSKLYLLPY